MDLSDLLGRGGEESGLSRRGLLTRLGVAGLGLVGAKAADNVLVGYGVLVGENLHSQDLAATLTDGFLEGGRTVRADGHWLRYKDGEVAVYGPDGEDRRARLLVSKTTPAAAADLDTALGLESGPLEEVVRDFRELESASPAPFEFADYAETFERAREADPRPYTTGLLRAGSVGVPRDLVAAFTDADPEDPEALVEALVGAFREETFYDLPRYGAGSIQDNVIGGAVDLRGFFRTDVGYETLVESDSKVGLFCYEFTQRSAEALHAVSPTAQNPPAAAAPTWDLRHKHVYTAVTSAVREDDRLVLPTTFVDYTHTTLYDDLHLTGVMGEGLAAYDRRHRASYVRWWH